MEREKKEDLQLELLAALEQKNLEAFRDLLRNPKVNPRHRYGKPHYRSCLEIAASDPFGKDFVKLLLEHVKPNINFIRPEPIHYAAKKGNADVLSMLLSDPRTRVNAHDSNGRTALHYACTNVTWANVAGYENCVKQLMGKMLPADINCTDVNGHSAIHAAAKFKLRADRLDNMADRLDNMADRLDNMADGEGNEESSPTIVESEVWRSRDRIIQVMLDVGRGVLDLDSVKAAGRTAREDILRSFPHLERHLPAGTGFLRTDPHTALTSALREDRIDLFRALLQETDASGNPKLDPNFWFGAPLHATCLEMACKKLNGCGFVEALLAAGADPNTANKLDEKFPIHLVCERGHLMQLKALLSDSYATDPNVRDRDGNTALHILVEKGRDDKRECLDLLLSKKNLDVNKKNKNELSALMLAIKYKNKYIVESIIRKKRDSLDFNVNFEERTLRERIMETFTDLANHLPETTEAISSTENEIDWFDLLQTTREYEFVQKIRENAPENLSIDNKKFTLLQRAARYGMENAVNVLLEKGADPNKVIQGNSSPPGVLATFYNHKGVMEIFLKHPDFKVNAVDGKGNSALHYAVSRDLDMVIHLLRRGADIGLVNNLGKTPLGKNDVHALLDQCIHTNGKNAQDEDYELIIDYRMLAPGRNVKSELIPSSRYETVPSDEIQMESEEKNHDLESEMDFLHMMSKDDELSSLLDHPVAKSFLDLKWSRVRPIAYFNFGIYLAFVVFLNMYIINSGSIHIFQNNVNTTQEFLNLTTPVDDTATFLSISFSELLAWFSLCVSIVLWLILCLREVVQFAFDQQKYIGSFDNYLDWTILLFGLVSLAMPVFQPENTLLSTIHVITIMVSCAELLVLMGRLSHFAKYIEMLQVVLCSYYLPLLSYCIIIIAFGLSFHTLFSETKNVRNSILEEYNSEEMGNKSEDFDTWYMSIIKSLVMMTGELSFDSFPDRSLLPIVLFVLFVFLVTVVLLNLLIGLAVNDTRKIEDMAEQLRLKTRVELVLFTESILINMHNSKWRFLKKLSSLLLWEKFQGAILFPWRTLEKRNASVKPNQNVEFVLAQEHGPGTPRQMPKELVDRATLIISRRSNETTSKESVVSVNNLDLKLEKALRQLAILVAAQEQKQMRVDESNLDDDCPPEPTAEQPSHPEDVDTRL